MTTAVARDEPTDGVLRLRLDRPEVRNAANRELVTVLIEEVRGAGDVGAIVLGSTDPRAFCSGLDLSLPAEERVEVSDLLYELYERMLAAPPIVAAIGGAAVGGGAQLAIAADLRVAAPAAIVRFGGPGHGLSAGAWGLPSLIGRGRAMDLCLTMRDVGAEEAVRIGLVDRLAEDPDAIALELAVAIAGLDRDAAARVKRIAGGGTSLLEALRSERRENLASWSGDVPDRDRG